LLQDQEGGLTRDYLKLIVQDNVQSVLPGDDGDSATFNDDSNSNIIMKAGITKHKKSSRCELLERINNELDQSSNALTFFTKHGGGEVIIEERPTNR